MAANDMDRVVPLSQLDDFKVADGEPDVRGWEVLASDGRKVGEVDELLVDTAAMKVRYLDVDVETAGGGHDRHVLIPIGYARLDDARDCVMLDSVASSELGGIPSYDQGPLTRDFESSLRQTFSARRGDTGGQGGGMMDTAGLDNTPGTGTGLSMTGAGGLSGAGMNAGASDLDERGNRLGSTGSSAGVMSSTDDGLGAGERMSAGSQGPPGGLDREQARGGMHGSPRNSAGVAGSDYLHGSGDDFYAGDAFDDARFYASRRRAGPTGGMGGSANEPTRGQMGLSAGTGGADQVDPLAGSGLESSQPTLHGAGQEGVGADREETSRLAQDARELLREDQANRDVPGGGSR